MRNRSGRHSRAVAFDGAEAKKSRSHPPRESAGSFRQHRLPLKSLSTSGKTNSNVLSFGTAGPNKCPLVFQKYRDKIPPQAAPFRIRNLEFGMEKPENEKQNSQIPWSYLPRSFYARTHGWPPPRHLAIYHANYTKGRDGVGQKLAQLREVDWMVRGGWPARILSIARRIPGRIFPLGSKDG